MKIQLEITFKIRENRIRVDQRSYEEMIPQVKCNGTRGDSLIVTKSGGILSHAAILSRELKKPCIVGVGESISILKNGDVVSVRADLGVVELVNNPSNNA